MLGNFEVTAEKRVMPNQDHDDILPIDRALARLASLQHEGHLAKLGNSRTGRDVGNATHAVSDETQLMGMGLGGSDIVEAGELGADVSDLAGPTGDERREHPRRDSSSRVLMSFGLMDTSDPAWTFRSTPHRGHLLDLSMRGAAFESVLPADPESVVALRLAGDEYENGRVIRAKIVRCDQSEGGFRIVCRFEQKLTLDDLHQYSRHRFAHDVV